MDIILNINKSVEQNAEVYYEKAKKFKRKIPGIKKIIDDSKAKIEKLEKGFVEAQKNKIEKPKNLKKEWFEKFRWFYSTDGFLVIGGRDATTNDIVIKKYLDTNDKVFHTELPGSPFVIIKNPENRQIPDTTIMEAAIFCSSYSKSWKAGRSLTEVYHINPEQVSREAKSGEYLQKGSFMIYGKRNFMTVGMSIALCNREGKIMAGPLSAIKKASGQYVEIIQGKDKLSDVGKKIQKIIGGELDEIIRALPPECTIAKKKG
jgi:predicted ribosome quality control (RQC) complex YloA/Tae2 family protein